MMHWKPCRLKASSENWLSFWMQEKTEISDLDFDNYMYRIDNYVYMYNCKKFEKAFEKECIWQALSRT